ncbi:MAG: hypothetical protein HDS75_02260 [Bacteroidales bacterium]|nr:hypothetical protein [Bacteroidales bacterium]MDE6802074.1 hypothetical protein [Muribaculaceae bacterium]
MSRSLITDSICTSSLSNSP